MRAERKINDEILIRPVMPDDRDFLVGVYRSAREMELSMVPWDEAMKRSFVELQFDAQTSYYASEHPTARHSVIELTTGEPVGRIYVEHSEKVIEILDVTVLPEYRGRGIGSAIIASIVDDARASGRSVQIYVETFNPSHRFFTSRGFAIAETGEVNFRLVWSQNQKS